MKGSKLFQSSIASIATVSMLGVLAPVTFADTSAASTQTTTWTVAAGPGSQNGLMAMAFFPNVITIDAGDSVTFKGTMHTVSFPGTDGKLPSAASPQAQMPAGGTTYDGSTFTSSGMLTDKPYTLQFTKPGVYQYYCLLHPGMMGVVIVNPAGTTYPMTQSQYDALAQEEEQEDFAAGNQAVNSFKLQSKKNVNGTTTYFAQTDAPESQAYSFNLSSEKGSNVTGSALVAFAEPPSQSNPNITYSLNAKLSGLTPGQTYSAMLCEGKSGSGVMVPNSQFGEVTVNADGTATVSGSVQASGLPQGIWYLDVYDASHNVVVSGLIDHPSFAYERFLPNQLKIHVGDKVVWTQTGSNELHTVTFLPKGWSDIPDEGLMPAPYGGHVYAGNGFFNSGFMIPGSTYEMTFVKAGDYQYRCLLHDFMGMISDVDVLPQAGESTVVLNDMVMNVPSKVVHDTTYVPISYIQELFNKAGVSSTWDGHNWRMTTSAKVHVSGIDVAKGGDHLYLNNRLVQNAAGMIFTDPSSGKDTTYLPLYDVQQALKAIGMNGTWDGNTWDVTPGEHAGSVPSSSSTTSESGTSSTTGSSDMSSMSSMD